MKASKFLLFLNSKLFETLWFPMTLSWVFLVFCHYFISGQETSVQSWNFLGSLAGFDFLKFSKSLFAFLKYLAYALAVIFTIWVWGKKIYSWIGFSEDHSFLKLSLEVGLGIIFFNTLWLGLGLDFLWFESLWIGLGLCLFLWAILDFIRELPTLTLWKSFPSRPSGFLPFFLLVPTFLCGTLCLAHGLAPDTYYDSLVYHDSVLSNWKFHHGIRDFPTNLYSCYPFGGELYFANGFFLQGTESAKLLNVFLMGLGATLAAMWAGKSGGPLGAWLSLGMIMTFPMYSVNAWTAHTEVVLSFFLILFFYCLFQIGEEGDKDQDSRLILGLGLFGGAALSVKYTALPPLMAGIFILGFNKIFPAGKKRWIFPVIALLIAALQDVPWFLKNYLYSGNPFYPYFSSFFSGRKIPPFLMDALLRDHMATFSSGEPLWKIPLRWFSIQWDRSNGPLFFSFIPFLIFGFIKGKVPKYLSLLVGLYFIFGFSISSQLRLMVPAFVLFYLLAGWVAGSVENRIWARTWAGVVAVYGFLALGTLLNLSLHFYHIDDLWLKGWNREDYLRRLPLTSTYYDLTEKCGEVVPSGNQLLIAGDARGLYYPRPFITNSNFDDQVLAKLAREEKDAEGIQHRLRQMGVDDLVVSATEGIRLAPQLSYYHLTLEEWKKLDDFMRRGTDLLYTGVHGAIYGVRGRLGPEDPLKPDLLLLFSDPTQGIQQKLRI